MQALSVCGFLYNDEKMLVARRSSNDSFMPGLWEMIGGAVEVGEKPEEALIREYKEELDIDIKVGLPYYTFTYVNEYALDSTHETEIDFMVILKDTRTVIKLDPEIHSEYRWVTEDKAIELFQQDHPANQLLAVKKGFFLLHDR